MKNMIMVLFLSLCWTALFLGLGIFSGILTVTASQAWLLNPLAFVYRHLRMSVVPFGALLMLYGWLIARIRGILMEEEVDLARLSYYDRLLNTTIATFFGVGVIWTAVGMESALMHALDGISGGDATSLTAWGLLKELVNGGLLLALSTTVVGGVCGYLLKMLKIVLIGVQWDRRILGMETERG
ncbi:hypothetical protein [Dissulfuribacter thermophilus]|uniref:hypothetical protein n=1 Tax=Dissulfuribacter thermophilus TaxID=1156395 RepID=UPI000830ABEF|nr:hypothetical protein [Dissulfuribacter thermophilus]